MKDVVPYSKCAGQPWFTVGAEPGPNYSSAELTALKEKHGIVDGPLQLIGCESSHIDANPQLLCRPHA